MQKELPILYEDKELLVCVKPAGVPVQSDRTGDYALTDQILNYLAGSQIPYLAVVHRLDRPVGGVMVFAKTKQAAAELSRQVREHEMRKRYYCILTGCKSNRLTGWQELTDYIITDKRTNLSQIADAKKPGAKKAELRFRILEQKRDVSAPAEAIPDTLVEVELLTGRHHQIRVQMTGMADGIWGDTKYNPNFTGKKGWFELALFSHELILTHPSTNQKLCFEALPEGKLFDDFFYIQRLRER